MLAFAGIESGINDSRTESHGGRMVKHGATYYAKKRSETMLISTLHIFSVPSKIRCFQMVY